VVKRQKALLWLALIASRVEMVKSKRFEGKVAIVTASTQGIGLAIAERLGLEGASVVISSRRQVQFSFLNFFSIRSILPFPFIFFIFIPFNYRSKMLTQRQKN